MFMTSIFSSKGLFQEIFKECASMSALNELQVPFVSKYARWIESEDRENMESSRPC